MKRLTVVLAAFLLGALNSHGTHEQFTLIPTPLMHVSVPWGHVVLHPSDDVSIVSATVDYPAGVHVSGGEDAGLIEFRISAGTATRSGGTLTVSYPSSTRVDARDEHGDILLVVPQGSSETVAVHSSHLQIAQALHLVRDDARAHVVLNAPQGTVFVEGA